jgi:hypothetical protein
VAVLVERLNCATADAVVLQLSFRCTDDKEVVSQCKVSHVLFTVRPHLLSVRLKSVDNDSAVHKEGNMCIRGLNRFH